MCCPSRELIASDIEAAVEGAQLDGMICLASCDKTTPGQLLAAGASEHPDDRRALRLSDERPLLRRAMSTSRMSSLAPVAPRQVS